MNFEGYTKTHSAPFHTSEKEPFANFILDIWQGSEYDSVIVS